MHDWGPGRRKRMLVARPGRANLVGHACLLRIHHGQSLESDIRGSHERRVDEHKRGLIPGFTTKYHVTRLVHFEQFANVRDAIAREKEIKGWGRARKIRLIEERNPVWEDLARLWRREPQRSS